MKQIKLFLSLLIIGAMAVSCEKDNDDNNTDVKLVTKIITTDAEGQKTTASYEYNGTKIKSITETSDWGTTVYTYTYTGDDISKIVQRNEDGLVKSQSFIHGGGKLLLWTENSETDADVCTDCETLVTAIVNYNTDGSQTVKYYAAGSEEVQKQVEVTYELSSNAPEITELDLDGTGFTVVFDGKANPHKNITGWTKLQRIDPYMYTEENVSGLKRYINDEHVSGDHLQFEYNSNNFPTTCTAFYGLYKKEYFYNK